jgi:ABC-type phosphonate transport system ATPase subunit
LLQAGIPEIGLDEPNAVEAEPARCLRSEKERRARQVRADNHAIGSRQVQRHLASPAADFDDVGIARDRSVEQPRERASSGTRAQRLQIVARRVTGKWSLLVEPADCLGTSVHVLQNMA